MQGAVDLSCAQPIGMTPYPADNTLGGPAYGDFVAALRSVQDLAAVANPPESVLQKVTRDLEAVAVSISDFVVPEGTAPAGRRSDLPGRGHPLLLPLVIDFRSNSQLKGRVIFSRAYAGSNGAAHGGALGLFFDEVLGVFVSSTAPSRVRTAYLHINYRNITPIGVELQVDVSIEKLEGRKIYATARLRDGDMVCADAEILLVRLNPGQP